MIVIATKKRVNKLVRDKIPEEISRSNITADYDYDTVYGQDLYAALKKKIVEEANELNKAVYTDEVIEELGDLMEAIKCFRKVAGIGKGVVKAAMAEKRERLGSFKDGIILKWVRQPRRKKK